MFSFLFSDQSLLKLIVLVRESQKNWFRVGKKSRNFSRGSLLSFMIHCYALAGPNVLVFISTAH